MRSAETCLAIIRTRGERKLPIDDLYRQLFNPDFYLQAYGKISRNCGAMTPGATPETADGMSLGKIDAMIEVLRFERYRWTPVRRVCRHGDGRSARWIAVHTWSDKLLQETMRMILEAYYEPQFSDHSHGFRRGRGCHSVLREIYYHWRGTVWFIEADIRQCFERIISRRLAVSRNSQWYAAGWRPQSDPRQYLPRSARQVHRNDSLP